VATREGALPDRIQRLFAAGCADRAMLNERASGRDPDPRGWRAVTVARELANGNATNQELTAAELAAWGGTAKAGAAAWWAAGWAATSAGFVAGWAAGSVWWAEVGERNQQVADLLALVDATPDGR
jgi:hypothetical protein